MEDLVRALRQRKISLLDKIEVRINTYIVSTGKNCIAVVERDDEGDVRRTWSFYNDLDDLAKMVYLFMRKKRAPSGRTLDSALTDPVLEIVKTEYQAFYVSETDAISMGLLEALASDKVMLTSFVDRITGIALKNVSDEAKHAIVEMISDQIKDSVSQGAMHSIGHQIGHIATTTAGTQIAAVVAQVLLKVLVANMGFIVAKVLASAALQHALMLIAKKMVIAAITSAVLNFLVVHFGAALAGTSVMWIVLPIMAGILTYKIFTFPEKLAKAVAKDVREELEKGFDGMNRTVLEKIFDAVFQSNELVSAIAKDPEFRGALRDLGEKFDNQLQKSKYGNGAVVTSQGVWGLKLDLGWLINPFGRGVE